MGSGVWTIEKRLSFRSESWKEIEVVNETGCLSIIVLGASGDLAKKKTFPALFNLYRQGFLQSNEVHIFGYARSKISDDDLRNRLKGYLVGKEPSSEQLVEVSKFLQLIKYVRGTVEDSYGKLPSYLYMLQKKNSGTITDKFTINTLLVFICDDPSILIKTL